MIGETLYHKSLRVCGLVLAVVLVFESGILFPGTRDLSFVVSSQFAAVIGMSASVEPTDLSTMTAELTKRQKALDMREAELVEREIQVEKSTFSGDGRMFEYILSAGLLLVLVLLVLNYIFDFLRARKTVTSSYEQMA